MALVEQEQPLPHSGKRVQLVWDRLERGDEVVFIASSRIFANKTVRDLTVHRLTDTLIVMSDGSKWYRKNGQRQASSDSAALRHPQDDHVIDVRQEQETRRFLRALEDYGSRLQAGDREHQRLLMQNVPAVAASYKARWVELEGQRRAVV